MKTIAELQEATLRERAEEEQVYRDLLYFYGAQRALDKLDALATDLDPKNETDLLVFELFQGTEANALVPLLKADADPWVRYSLLKALLKNNAFEQAMGLWKKSLQWQNPDLLLANTLIQYALIQGHFDEANQILPSSRKLAPDQPELDEWQSQVSARSASTRELQLDPMPSQSKVAFVLATQGAAPYLEQTLGGIIAQNHPLSDVVIVDNGAMDGLADLQQQYPFRLVKPEDGALPADVEADFLATVPPSSAPALDYVQQFLLALENGPENIGRASGRIEDFYQDSPGDHWRVMRMTVAMPETRCVGPEVPACGANFRPREGSAGSTDLYLPEAVACGLRQDTLDSAMTAFWKEQLPARMDKGDFKNGTALVGSFNQHLERTIGFINDDVDGGRSSLVFPDFLFLFHAVAMDAQFAVAQGLFDAGTAAYIQQQVIQSIKELDREYKRDLVKKVRDGLNEHLVQSTEVPDMAPEVTQALDTFVKDLHALYNGVNQDLYLAIFG